jgi:zinc protease
MKIRPLLLALLLSVAIPAAANAITVRAVQSPSGVETWLSEEHAIPIIAVNIAFPAGSAYDPSDKPGLATLVSSLLDEGAGDLASEAFKQALEARAIRIGASADRDYITVSMTTLKENADEAFRLLGLVLSRPRFDSEAVERMRVAILASLKQEDEQPSTVASKSWFATYFGTHPYAHSDSGTPSGVQAITINDIKTFAADHFVRDRVKVAVAGDINDADLRRYLQQLFTSMPTKSVPQVARAADAGRSGTNTIPRNEPAPVAMFGFAGPMRLDADFIPTFVANYILGGGGFSSRLMDEIRDKRGLTYGISTYLADYKSASLIVGSVQSEKTKILTALDVTKSELARFARDGATAKELADAKTYLTGSYPLGLDSNAKIARTLNAYQRQGLTADYVEKRNALIQAVTLAQVNAMAKKWYDPSKLVVVIAGTPEPIGAAPSANQGKAAAKQGNTAK